VTTFVVPLVNAGTHVDAQKDKLSIPRTFTAFRRVFTAVLATLEDAHALVTGKVHAEGVLAGAHLSIGTLDVLGLVLVGTGAPIDTKEEHFGVPSAFTGAKAVDAVKVRRRPTAEVVVTLVTGQNGLTLAHPHGLVGIRAKLRVGASLRKHLGLKGSPGFTLGNPLGSSFPDQSQSFSLGALGFSLGTLGVSPRLGLGHKLQHVLGTLAGLGLGAPIGLNILEGRVEGNATPATTTNDLDLKGADEVGFRAILDGNGKIVLAVKPAVASRPVTRGRRRRIFTVNLHDKIVAQATCILPACHAIILGVPKYTTGAVHKGAGAQGVRWPKVAPVCNRINPKRGRNREKERKNHW